MAVMAMMGSCGAVGPRKKYMDLAAPIRAGGRDDQNIRSDEVALDKMKETDVPRSFVRVVKLL